MKKNAMLKIAAILMVAVLLTTCAISSTFAKYVTTASGSDEARVAKWGVQASVAIDDLFKTMYDGTTAGNSTVVSREYKQGEATITDDVVAPGTAVNMETALVVTGQPEVDVTVTPAITVTLNGWTDEDGHDYCPLIFTITKGSTATEYYIGANGISTAPALASAVKGALEKALLTSKANDGVYKANTNLGTEIGTVQFGWRWNFTNVDGYDNQNDTDDSYLGDKAAGLIDGATAPTVEVSIGVTITQVN